MRVPRLLLTAFACAALLGPAAGFAQTAAPAMPATAAPAMPATAAPAAPAAPAMKGMTMSPTAAMPMMVNINTASAKDLDKLPQIGKARSAKIIKNRPYKSTDELLTKKVLSKGVYEKIKTMVTTS